MKDLTLMLACAQAGVTAASLGLGVVAEPAFAHLFEPLFRGMGGTGASHALAALCALLLVVYVHVVFGEMLPKNLAIAGPQRTVLLFGPPLVYVARAISPVLRMLNWMAGLVLRMCRVQPRSDVASAFTADEVASMVEISQAEGAILGESGELLADAIDFSQTQARKVMVPLDELVVLPHDVTVEGIEAEVTRTGFSRFPLCDGSRRIVGYVHVKDVLLVDESHRTRAIDPGRIRAMDSVDAEAKVSQVLESMQLSGTHLVRVGTGGVDLGVIFLEDILEELVGEVVDASQRDVHDA
jgi:CBS domain containing-hemolysin-like protein